MGLHEVGAVNEVRQPSAQCGDEDANDGDNQKRYAVRNNGLHKLADFNIFIYTCCDKQVDTDGRSDGTENHAENNNNAEPNEVIAKSGDDGGEDGNGKKNNREGVHEHTNNNIEKEHHQHDEDAVDVQRADPCCQVLGQVGNGEEVTEYAGADHDLEYHDGALKSVHAAGNKALEGEAANKNGVENCKCGADSSSFGVGEDTGEHTAKNNNKENNNGENADEALESGLEAVALALGSNCGIDGANDGTCNHVSKHEDDTGNDTGSEETANGEVTGGESVNDETGGGRNQPAESAACGAGSGGEVVVILKTTGLGKAETTHGSNGSGRRTADSAEYTVRNDSSEVETTTETTKPLFAAIIETLTHTGLKSELTHEAVERYNNIAESGCGGEGDSLKTFNGHAKVIHGKSGADDANQDHADTDVHTHEKQNDHNNDTQDGQKSEIHNSGSFLMFLFFVFLLIWAA